ncbi:hypothetical protein GCM10009603_59460 [Nocardiopsis exhalans]
MHETQHPPALGCGGARVQGHGGEAEFTQPTYEMSCSQKHQGQAEKHDQSGELVVHSEEKGTDTQQYQADSG